MGWTNTQTDELTLPPGATTSQPRIVIGPQVPTVLSQFYAGLGQTVTSAILIYDANGNYQYMAGVTLVGGSNGNLAIGIVTGPNVGDVSEEMFFDAAGSFSGDLTWEDTTGQISAGNWTSISPLNGFTNRGGYVGLQWRRVTAPGNSIQIVGELVTGTVASGTIIGNIPAPHRPEFATVPLVVQSSNTPAGKTTVLEFDTAGNLKLYDYGAGVIGINGLYPLGA